MVIRLIFITLPIYNFLCLRKNIQFNNGEENYYHTNCSPSEYIILYNNNDIVDSLIINSDLYYGLSVGKNEDGSNQWCYFDTPTPNSSNNSSYCFSNITNEAIINIQSGWYEMSQTIIIEPQDGTIVFYTMDVSIPSSDDIAYTQPIEINEILFYHLDHFHPINYHLNLMIELLFLKKIMNN